MYENIPYVLAAADVVIKTHTYLCTQTQVCVCVCVSVCMAYFIGDKCSLLL